MGFSTVREPTGHRRIGERPSQSKALLLSRNWRNLMSITKTLLAGAAGTVLASGMAAASEPMKLSHSELDQVSAGFFNSFVVKADSDLFGLAGVLNVSLKTGGVETVNITSPTNFDIKITANASGTATGIVQGGIIQLGDSLVLFEGVGVLGSMQASTIAVPAPPF